MAIENGQWIFLLKMVIFHSYVSLPEGIVYHINIMLSIYYNIKMYIYTVTYPSIYTYMHTHIHIHIHVDIDIDIDVEIDLDIDRHRHRHTGILAYFDIDRHTNVYTSIHPYIHTIKIDKYFWLRVVETLQVVLYRRTRQNPLELWDLAQEQRIKAQRFAFHRVRWPPKWWYPIPCL